MLCPPPAHAQAEGQHNKAAENGAAPAKGKPRDGHKSKEKDPNRESLLKSEDLAAAMELIVELRQTRNAKPSARHNVRVVGAKTPLDGTTINRLIVKRSTKLTACNPDRIAGELQILFYIEPSGKVIESELSQASAELEGVGRCMAKQLLGWRFPRPGEPGQEAVYEYHSGSTNAGANPGSGTGRGKKKKKKAGGKGGTP
jgi:hypothetical protein